MKDKKITLWCDTFYLTNEEIESWKEDIKEWLEYSTDEEYDDYYLDQKVEEDNDSYKEDTMYQLDDIKLPNDILCVADFGLWYGHRTGVKTFDTFSDIFTVGYDFGMTYENYYVDDCGNLKAEICHHDGRNYYTFRVFKPGVDADGLVDKYECGIINTDTLLRNTIRLGDFLQDYYGWRGRFKGTRSKCVKCS